MFNGLKASHKGIAGVLLAVMLAGSISLVALARQRSLNRSAKNAAKVLQLTASATNAQTPSAKSNEKPAQAVATKPRVAAKRVAEAAKSPRPEAAKSSVLPGRPRQIVLAPPITPQRAGKEEQESSDIGRERANWFFEQRAYPNQHIPEGALQKAIEQRDAMKAQQRAAAQLKSSANAVISFPGDALWHLMGPQPVNEPFSVNGGFPTASGRVTAIAVDQTDATGNTVYIGGAAGGVWKTTNGGTDWTPLTDSQPSLAIGSITIDPNNHLTIYVGTGEENFNGDAYYGAGILKSTDGGTTWAQIGASTFAQVLGPNTGGAYIGQIAVQPGNSSIVLAAVSFFVGGTIGGIYRSADGGNTWAEDASPRGLAATSVLFESTINAGTAATAWAAMGNPFGEAVNGIYKSTDSGQTWTLQAGGAPSGTTLGRVTLAYGASTSGSSATLYAAVASSSSTSSNLLNIYKTANGGTSWTTVTGPGQPAGGFCNSQCFYDMAVGVSPANASFVLLGGGAFTNNSSTVFRSTDGGATWTDITVGSTNVRPHVDTHAFAFNASAGRFFVGNDGGMWRTDGPSATPPLWVDLNAGSAPGKGLATLQFYPGPSAAISDENSGYGGTQDNDTEIFSGTLDWTNVFACGDGGFTAIDSQTPTTIYTTCDRGAGSVIAQSVFNGEVLAGPSPTFNGADTGINRNDRMQFIPPLTIDDTNPNNLYFGSCRVWATTNAATAFTPSWTAISGDLSAGNTLPTTCPAVAGNPTITTIDVGHSNSNLILAGTNNGKVWETTTGGILWTEIDGGLLPNRHVTAVRTMRNDSTGNIAFVTFSGFGSCAGCGATPGHVFVSTNAAGGAPTWTNISGDLPDIPVNDLIVYHQGNPTYDALYIATDVGVFSCPSPATTLCANWTVIGDGLPNSPVLGLAMRRNTRILRAATHGRSMWQIQLTDVSPPPLAALSSVTPAVAFVGDAAKVVTVSGLNFSSNTQVQFSGLTTGVTTAFVSTTQLNVTLNASLFTVGGVFPITLTDPAGVDSGSVLGTGGLPFAVMNPILNPQSMTPSSALTYTAVPLHLTSTAGEPFVAGSVLAFYDTSVPPNLQFQLSGGTVSSGGTAYDLTTPITQFTTPFSYQVVPFNPTPGGGIDPASPAPFPLTITANPGPLAIFNPNPIVLGPIAVGANTSITTFQIQNPGSTNALNITAATLTPVNPPAPAQNFKFVAPTLAPSCNFENTGIATVGAGASCFFGIQYTAGTPPGNANSTATLTVTDNAPTSGSQQAISVTGLVNTALVAVTPVNFGSVAIGTTSPTMNATLINFNTVALNVNPTGFTISGANAADFHFTTAAASGNPACPALNTFALAANSLCDVGLNFTPSIAGAENATIKVADDGPGSPQNAPLFGVGVQITSISPSIVATGGPAFTLTVNGGGFAASAVVNVNGSARLTTFVSANQLLASIPASDIAAAGSLAISVTTPVPGGVQSEPKTLVVAQAFSATNDNINFATVVNPAALPFRIAQDTTKDTPNTGGVNDPAVSCGSNSVARSVWFSFKPTISGRVVADTRFSSYTTILSAWTGSIGSLSAVAGACATGNIPAAGASPVESFIGFNVTANTQYYIMVTDANTNGAGGTLTASLDFASAPPVNDDFNSALVVAAPPSQNTVNSISATTDTGGRPDPTPSCATGAGLASSGKANTVWYDFSPPTNGTITADTLTSPYATILTAVTGIPGSFVEKACNVSAGPGIAQSQVTFPVTGGTVYSFMVSAFFGDGGTTNFHLNFSAGAAGVPASITATSGTPQSATISTAFAAPLVATVKDSFNNPVNGVLVTFTPPASGASGTFAGGVNTATTNASGVATSATFTANSTAGGPYNVAATVSGVATPANFSLTNKTGAAAKVAATSGTPQSTAISTAFGAPLVATVTDSGNNPVSGVVVTFTPPASGASGTFAGGVNTATTNASGVATSATFTANATAGGPYNVVASATGATSANFVLTNTAGAAAKVTATSGSGQNATISTAFAAPLVATVTDAGNNPVSGVLVTFTPPASGASGTFAGGVNTATTNASGGATSAVFTANATAGGPYNVVASATGATSANFALTNKTGAAAKVAATSGTPQSTTISTAFAAPLVATVTDAGNNPVSGVVVTFTPPASGASGTFAGGVNTATTNASGVATSATFTANATAGGPYNVVASATGATSANFSLTNTSGTPTKVAATSGTPQSTTISTAFGAPLVATVTDAGSNPVSGVVVTFTPPASGASGTFAGGVNTATTNASGVATSATFTANSTAGGPYNVVASATGATSANFALTNTAGAAAKVTATSGSGQNATISTAFAAPLVATVTDAGNNPVSGAVVTFTPPASGASGTFAGGVNTATTNASGVATSAVFTANATAGGPYNVVASATGATSANFSLTNKAGAAAKVAVTSGSGQSATISTAFAAPLVATVTDAGNNPVSGVLVTFTPPASGASGTFAGGVNTATTNASGVATSATFTANATAGGPYNVVASAAGATSANFSLTNTTGAAAKVTATSGTPQSTTISTAFAAPLVATVTDSGNNPVSGVLVTFTPPASGASGTFAGGVNTATTNASGVATSATFTANATAGGPYNVVASATGATSANFSLTNKAGAAAKVAATSGTPQSTAISTAFAAPLVATVTDSGNNPVSGVLVTFTPPAGGASGTFAGGVNTATTNASGVATSATFTANATAGGPYNVVASATGATSANFSLTNNAGAAAKVAVTSGSGQSTAINTAFAAPLVATVTDSGNNPVSGVVVTFTPPASGASGTFAGGVNTATTNASGVATSAVFTANGTAGGPYNVVASATGASSANFSLTNTAVPPGKVAITGGSGQSAIINAAFGAPLVATVTDASNNPVSGAVVTFTPPASGASGTFAGGVNTATTNASGVATSATFTANSTAGGPYNVVASSPNTTSANFSLTNLTGPAAKVTATSGTPQNATISTAFAAPLVATVTDAGNNPVSGVVVTFTPPVSGASGTFAGGVNTATTNASGVATSATFTANATAGGPYNVVASAIGATSANFSLTNTAGAAAKVTATSGTPQSATISTAFAAPLVATVTDSGNNPVSGVVVTFAPPASGASGAFAGGVNTATTNASGVATSATFTANATAGGPYNVVASATGATSANFALTNKVGAAAKVTATSGTPQSTAINTAFAAPLVATVTDSGNNPVSGVVVTFTPPASGASGTFAGGVNTATTNASGVATSAVFTANATAGGPYNVVASATGATSANFALTNTAGAPAKVAATSGTPQSAPINTAFGAPLVATVTDAGNNPVSGVVVTFTPPASGASGTFAGGVNTATTNASGVATSAAFTANSTVGGPYNVVASATGAASANFALTNNAGPPAKVSVTSGSGQSATINTAFAAPLVATVTDAGNNLVSGVVVTFTPPASGASGTFAGGVNTATTNASGVATSAVFTANSTSGGPYNVVASVSGATSANFSLTNKTGPPAKVAATSGTPQSATISTAFASPLVATVTDAGNNPVSGVLVTFTPPASGASGSFAGGVNTATTNASGVATSAVFTANGTAGGPYNVVASVAGATSANFALTNNNPVPAITPPLVPASTTAGGAAFLLTINGTNFVAGATVTFGSNPALTPVSITPTKITVTIPPADFTSAGTPNVTVTNPGPGGGASAPAAFTVNNPVPTLATATAGGNTHISGGVAFVLTVTGTNFVSGNAGESTVVNFNGKAEPTTFVSATQVTAAVPATDAATAGTFPVTVTNPAPAGGTTAAVNFTIDGFTVSGPASTTVKAGQQAMIQISVKPTANGFTNAVTSFSVSGLPAHTTFTFSPTSVTPNGATVTTTLTVTTIARGEVPPTAPPDPPVSPLLRLLPVLWLAALLSGLYAMQAVRRVPQLRRYAAIVPLALLLISGAVLAGCAGGKTGTAAGTSQLSITATSGSMSQTTPANSVALTVQ